MQNKNFCTAFQPGEKHALASLIFFCFLSILLGLRVPKLTSLMHDLIVRHCGGFWPQPTTPSIKYGTVAFKAMLNVPDTLRVGVGVGGKGRALYAGEVKRGTLWNCWGECFKYQIITVRLRVIVADLCLTDVHVCTSVFRFFSRKKKAIWCNVLHWQHPIFIFYHQPLFGNVKSPSNQEVVRDRTARADKLLGRNLCSYVGFEVLASATTLCCLLVMPINLLPKLITV